MLLPTPSLAWETAHPLPASCLELSSGFQVSGCLWLHALTKPLHARVGAGQV
jgi:hypothetical protein